MQKKTYTSYSIYILALLIISQPLQCSASTLDDRLYNLGTSTINFSQQAGLSSYNQLKMIIQNLSTSAKNNPLTTTLSTGLVGLLWYNRDTINKKTGLNKIPELSTKYRWNYFIALAELAAGAQLALIADKIAIKSAQGNDNTISYSGSLNTLRNLFNIIPGALLSDAARRIVQPISSALNENEIISIIKPHKKEQAIDLSPELEIYLNRVQHFGAKPLLIYGPTGNGKTTSALHIAQKQNVNAYLIKASEFASIYKHGVGDKINKTQNELKRLLKPGEVVIIDECEMLAGQRGENKNDNSDNSATLALMDWLEKLKEAGAIVIGTTNHYEKMDPAALRRFDTRIHLPNPNKKLRKSIAQYAITKKNNGIIKHRKTMGLPSISVLSEHATEKFCNYIAQNTEGLAAHQVSTIAEKIVEYHHTNNIVCNLDHSDSKKISTSIILKNQQEALLKKISQVKEYEIELSKIELNCNDKLIKLKEKALKNKNNETFLNLIEKQIKALKEQKNQAIRLFRSQHEESQKNYKKLLENHINFCSKNYIIALNNSSNLLKNSSFDPLKKALEESLKEAEKKSPDNEKAYIQRLQKALQENRDLADEIELYHLRQHINDINPDQSLKEIKQQEGIKQLFEKNKKTENTLNKYKRLLPSLTQVQVHDIIDLADKLDLSKIAIIFDKINHHLQPKPLNPGWLSSLKNFAKILPLWKPKNLAIQYPKEYKAAITLILKKRSDAPNYFIEHKADSISNSMKKHAGFYCKHLDQNLKQFKKDEKALWKKYKALGTSKKNS